MITAALDKPGQLVSQSEFFGFLFLIVKSELKKQIGRHCLINMTNDQPLSSTRRRRVYETWTCSCSSDLGRSPRGLLQVLTVSSWRPYSSLWSSFFHHDHPLLITLIHYHRHHPSMTTHHPQEGFGAWLALPLRASLPCGCLPPNLDTWTQNGRYKARSWIMLSYHKCYHYHQYFYLMVISPGEKGCVYFTNLSRAKLVGVKNQPKGFSFFLNWCRCRFSEIVLLWQVWINFLKVSNPKVFIVHLQWFCRSSRPYELGKSVTDWPGSVLDTCYHI